MILWKEPGGLRVAYTKGRRIVAMRPRHTMKIGVLLFGLAMYAGGCVTPVIPLPPPDTDYMELALNSCDATAKTIKFKGNAKFTANGNYVLIFNDNTYLGRIIQATADGGFPEVKDFPAEDGHKLQVWVKAALYEENKSDTVNVTVDCTRKKGTGNGFVKWF